MFREMRRSKQILSKEETIEILNKCTAGVLGVIGDEGYPYTVPVSYTYRDNKIYIHSAKEGHKIDSILRNNKVSFSVIGSLEVVPNTFTTHYTSVTLFGRARILEEDSEKRYAMESIVEKYSAEYMQEGLRIIEEGLNRVCLFEIAIEQMTGKRND